MSYKAVNSLWTEIKENSKKLRSCPKHNFGKFDRAIHLDAPPHKRQKMVCKNCGGAEFIEDILSYTRGYRAAGGDVEDIIQGFFDEVQ